MNKKQLLLLTLTFTSVCMSLQAQDNNLNKPTTWRSKVIKALISLGAIGVATAAVVVLYKNQTTKNIQKDVEEQRTAQQVREARCATLSAEEQEKQRSADLRAVQNVQSEEMKQVILQRRRNHPPRLSCAVQ